jgi:malonyl CoA-acyl carrier protein transacylase
MTNLLCFPRPRFAGDRDARRLCRQPGRRQTIAEASDALQFDLGKLIAEGPKEELDLTTNTQPVMLTAAVAFYRAWLAAGGKAPALVAGHSLGEYSALVAAGVILQGCGAAGALPRASHAGSRAGRAGRHGGGAGPVR